MEFDGDCVITESDKLQWQYYEQCGEFWPISKWPSYMRCLLFEKLKTAQKTTTSSAMFNSSSPSANLNLNSSTSTLKVVNENQLNVLHSLSKIRTLLRFMIANGASVAKGCESFFKRWIFVEKAIVDSKNNQVKLISNFDKYPEKVRLQFAFMISLGRSLVDSTSRIFIIATGEYQQLDLNPIYDLTIIQKKNQDRKKNVDFALRFKNEREKENEQKEKEKYQEEQKQIDSSSKDELHDIPSPSYSVDEKKQDDSTDLLLVIEQQKKKLKK